MANKAKEYTASQKREILANYVETLVQTGYWVAEVMGRPLAWFNYEAVMKRTDELREEYEMEPVAWDEVVN